MVILGLTFSSECHYAILICCKTRKQSKQEMEEKFLLEEDENYEKVCGELLLTSNKRLAIHCTFCDERYRSFDAYYVHLFEEHENTTETTYEDPDSENFYNKQEVGLSFLENEFLEDADNCENTVKIEISCFDAQALKEEEIPISTLMIPDDSEKKSKDSQRHKTKDRMDRDKKQENVIRSVKRRTLWKSRSTNDVEKKHKCPICGLGFKEKHNMHHHLKRHSSKKDHACPDCGRTFYTPSEVRTHLRLHSAERNYLCSDCGRSFKKSSDLKNHIKRHENQRDFKCTMCHKAFFNSKTLKNHMVVHSNEKPFSCPVCYSSFSRTLSLSNHMKLHENKRAYKCSICGSGFNQQAGLFSHMKATHNKRK